MFSHLELQIRGFPCSEITWFIFDDPSLCWKSLQVWLFLFKLSNKFDFCGVIMDYVIPGEDGTWPWPSCCAEEMFWWICRFWWNYCYRHHRLHPFSHGKKGKLSSCQAVELLQLPRWAFKLLRCQHCQAVTAVKIFRLLLLSKWSLMT